MSLTARAVAVLALLLALAGGCWKLYLVIDRGGYDRAKSEDAAAMQAQATRNRELQRQAELRYVVQGEVRERFIVQTVTEIRHETENLAACVLTPGAARRLRNAAACARGDSAAACGAGEPVPGAR